ncbi:protein E6A [Equid gammaherpesvirus 2]|nr:protein E6A [Equid gammaherpesvirus 2]
MKNQFFFSVFFVALFMFVLLKNMHGKVFLGHAPAPKDLEHQNSETLPAPPACTRTAPTLNHVISKEENTTLATPACACKVLEANFSCVGTFSCVGYSWGCSCCCLKTCKNVTLFLPLQ